MTGRRSAIAGTALLSAALALPLSLPARAELSIKGKVRLWNPLKDAYEPLKEARVRVVLWECIDPDTLDVETSTNHFGIFKADKGDPWWGDGYWAEIIVFAEVSNRLEVQKEHCDIDGYQAVSAKRWVDEDVDDFNIDIGGPTHNVDHFQAKGIACLGAGAWVYPATGWRAFFICHEMTDHRLFLQDRGWLEGDFEEKEVSYPIHDGAVYRSTLDYIRIPDDEFGSEAGTGQTWEATTRTSYACRHEFSHGIMADYYWDLPDIAPEGHDFDTPSPDHGMAWGEAWAEFMGDVTCYPHYGPAHPSIDDSASLTPGDTVSPDLAKTEGRIARALWDIHDPIGWETRARQYPQIPEENQEFYDGIAGPDLHRIRKIFIKYHPHGFSHETYSGDPDNIVYYWLKREKFGYEHELKAVCFNQGIHAPEFTQHAPTVRITGEDYEGCSALLEVQVTEVDPEDRPHINLSVFVGNHKSQLLLLDSGWQGDTNTLVVEQPIAWVKGTPGPVVVVAADDNIEAAVAQRQLNPPDTAAMDGLIVEVIGINVARTLVPENLKASYWPANIPPLYDLGVIVKTDDIEVAERPTRFPSGTGWKVTTPVFEFDEVTEVYNRETVPGRVDLKIECFARQSKEAPQGDIGEGGSVDLRNQQTVEIPFADSFGFGNPTPVPVLDEKVELDDEWTVRNQVEVVYRTRPFQRQRRDLPARPAISRTLPPGMGGSILETQRPGERDVRTRPPLTSTQPLTLSRLLSKSVQLVDECARLQAEALAIGEELEWKLGPEPPQQPAATGTIRRGGPGADRLIRPGASQAKLLRANLLTQAGLVSLPPTTFLDGAVQGQLALQQLTPEQKECIRGLRTEAAAREKRLPEIESQAAVLGGQLKAALAKVQTAPQLSAAGRAYASSALTAASDRLAALAPTVPPYQTLLVKERQVATAALKGTALAGEPTAPEPEPDRAGEPRRPATGASEDFEAGTPQRWTFGQGAAIERAGTSQALVLSGVGQALWRRPTPAAFTLTFRYRHGDGTGEVGFCLTGAPPDRQAYYLLCLPNRVALRRAVGESEARLEFAQRPLEAGEWYEVEVTVDGGKIAVALDGENVLSVTDADPLPAGRLAFGCREGSGCAFDDVRIEPLP